VLPNGNLDVIEYVEKATRFYFDGKSYSNEEFGRLELFTGYRVQHSISRGPAKGWHPLQPSNDSRNSWAALMHSELRSSHFSDNFNTVTIMYSRR